MIELRVKDKNKMKDLLVSIMTSLIFLFCGGWAINHYFLPSVFHPLSLLGDAGILAFTVCLGIVLTKLKLRKIYKAINRISVRRIASILFVLLLVLNVYVVIDGKINNPQGPNVILIIVDTLRADHLGCYGYNKNNSPNINRFSAESILFKNAISMAPWTTPSVASIFTSQFPASLGFSDEPVVLDEELLTIAEIFKEQNYKTEGIISHYMLATNLGFGQGFDKYNEKNAKGHGHISSPSIAQKAISFLEKNKKQKFFLFLHFFDPHYDYILHNEYNFYPTYDGTLYSGLSVGDLREKAPRMSENDIKFIKALYDSEIKFTDNFIGNLFTKLKELGLDNNTMIIFTADHGEEFLERGDYWIGHTKKLYQEQIHVPLIIKIPDNKESIKIDDHIGLIDLMPTIVEFAGLKIPEKYLYKGEAIDLDNKDKLKNKIIISETKRYVFLQSVIWDGWKLILDSDMNLKELYNLNKDPSELNNVVSENDMLLKTLEKILKDWNLSVELGKSQEKAKKPKFSEEQKQHLRSLGYIK